jgi:hypothetical protein
VILMMSVVLRLILCAVTSNRPRASLQLEKHPVPSASSAQAAFNPSHCASLA